ncbi:hypothetical protein MTP99_009190 [Tenebrio molitor]|nr:hypothetical protein MTP99_009190 [Tenebrio molitor]
MWGQYEIYWVLVQERLCQIPAPRRVRYCGVGTGRSSDFCGLRQMVQWGREVDSRRTVQFTSRCYSRLAELFRSRGSPPPWPARCPLVPPRGGAGLMVRM